MSEKKLAVLTGWPYYRGRLKFHDLMAVMTNLTPYSAFAFLEVTILTTWFPGFSPARPTEREGERPWKTLEQN